MLANWVKEVTATTYTGAIALGGAPAGYIPFSAAFASGSSVYYAIEDGSNREIGIGRLASGSPWTLTRSQVLETLVGGVYSDNAPAPIALSGAAAVSVVASAVNVPANPINSAGNIYDAYIVKAGLNVTLTANRLYAMPFFMTRRRRVSTAALRQVVTAGAAGTVGRLGLYCMDTAGAPGTLLAEGAGTIALDSTGYGKSVSLQASITLQPGMYYLALLTNSAAVVGGIDTNTWNHPYMGSPNNYEYADRNWRRDVGGGWSAMPADLTALCTPSVDYAGQPRLYMS